MVGHHFAKVVSPSLLTAEELRLDQLPGSSSYPGHAAGEYKPGDTITTPGNCEVNPYCN